MITREFNLYLHAGHSIPLVINVNQYDHGEQWLFTLFNSDGTQYVPSSGAIVGIKSDNLGIINTGSVDSQGRVVINETQQMTAAVGKAVFELVIDDGAHGTANFVVLVEPKPGDNADLSETDISMIEQAIEAASTIKPYGSPLVASTVAGMTDHEKVYVYVGSETGYTSGNWYYWDGSAWTSGGVYNSVAVQTDTTLTLSGVAADSKKVGDEISDLKSQIEQSGGLTSAIKSALMQLANNVAFKNTSGQSYIDDLYDALYPPIVYTAITLDKNSLSFGSLNSTQQLTATTTPRGGAVTWTSSNPSVATVSQTGLVTAIAYGNATITATCGSLTATCSVAVAQATVTSISAVYTQSGTVYDDASLDSLKSDLVVTAHWSNGTTSTVPSADYTLSGTLAVGTSTITASYGGQTATFNVAVSAIPNHGTFTPTNIVENTYINTDGTTVSANYASYSSDYYDSYSKAVSVNFANLKKDKPNWRFNEYDANKTFLRQTHIANVNGDAKGQPQILTMLEDTKYFRLSWYGEDQLRVPEVTVNNAPYVNLHMEIGDVDTTTGEDIEQPKRIRSVDYIPVSGSSVTVANYKPFLASTPSVTGYYGYLARCYDSSKNLIGSLGWTTANNTFTLPENTAYIRPIIQFGNASIPNNFDEYACMAFIIDSINYRIVKA